MGMNVVGIGLNGLSGLSENVKVIIENATVLVGSDRNLNYIPASHSAKRIVLGNFQSVIEEIRQHSNEKIVVLASGDPLFFGFGRLLLEHFSAEQLTFHPHLSSIQLAFNRLKLPWQNAKVISVHGRSLDELISLLKQGEDKIAILTDNINTPSAIAHLYLSLDLPIFYEFWVCENLGGLSVSDQENFNSLSQVPTDFNVSEPLSENQENLKFERVRYFAPKDLENETFDPLNVVVLVRQKQQEKQLNLQKLPLFGIPDSLFLTFRDRPGLMTKREVRIHILGELALQPSQIVWDIGAGTGTISIEIARLCPTSQVYAIEKTAMGSNLIEQNCQRFQVKNVTSINGKAPDILSELPNPNRVFIGGSAGNLVEILNSCETRLAQDGIIVLALATLEHLHLALEWLRQKDWNYNLLQLQISRSIPIASLTRLSPLNPVTLITAKRC